MILSWNALIPAPAAPRRLLIALGGLLLSAPGRPVFASIYDGYMNHAGLLEAVNRLNVESEACTLDVIGASREQRGLLVLTLTSDPALASQRPALLITAGLDGRDMLGTEISIRVARSLLTDHAGLLDDVTVYVIPRVNPDGAELNLGEVNSGHIGTLRAVDADRDGAADEDSPRDLNGDGVITQMRRIDPPIDDPPTHMADPAEPRLLIKPESNKGQGATYSLYVEGLDADGDGRIAEDPRGMVDLDRNFMHRWPQFADDAGPYQLSELESLALAQFVLEHRNIVAAITYGRHDNLINVPDGKGKDITGRGPKDLDPGDVDLYKEMSKLFKDITGQKRAAGEDAAGAFHAWLYAQRGIPSFATVVWGRPDPVADEKKVDAAEDEKDKPIDAEAAAWLAYSDRERGGAGFVEWQPFDHPTLGAVEIGGFVPGFQMNPPMTELDDLAAKQTAFAVEIANRRPQIVVTPPVVKRLATGLYEIRLSLRNEGFLPMTTAMARKARALPPMIVRLSTPVDGIVAGERVNRSWGIEGSGGRFDLQWIVLAEDGAEISIEIENAATGSQTIRFNAMEEQK